MRVITGTARGVPLRAPKGMDTRPTLDQVKEGIFSVIQFEVEGRRVLDLFADLIFLDPPYAEKFLENALLLISEIDILSDSGIIICERPAEKRLPDAVGALSRDREYQYGRAAVTIFRRHLPERSV